MGGSWTEVGLKRFVGLESVGGDWLEWFEVWRLLWRWFLDRYDLIYRFEGTCELRQSDKIS